ncbi:alginate lyase family protein [Hansschlegelia beijingensis]|uniref:alginate lyase family protein n=1 Tax=Hansschlegelia beijingensis TaxID=1133344 RepID=UPI00387EEC4C
MTRAAAERGGVTGPAASCAFAHILSFARQDTFLKSTEWNETGGVRLYATPPILAYAILKSSSLNTTEGYPGPRPESEQIERWIRRLGDRIKSFIDLKPYGNNIDAWGAAALASAAVALNDRSYLDHAVSVAVGILEQVDGDGALPAEMKRGARALEYSLFATQALVLVDAVAEANGNLALREANGGALQRLIDLMVSAAEDPIAFYKSKGIAGYDSAVSQVYRQNLAWLPLAEMMRVNPRIKDLSCRFRPLYSVWTAGNWEYYLDRRPECG